MASGVYRLGKKQKAVIMELYSNGSALAIDFLINKLLPKDTTKQQKFFLKKSINNLENNNLIIKLGGERIKITNKGKNLIKNFEIENIFIEKHNWDGIWRLISYDIPKHMKKERDYFRRKLKEMGFRKLQDSLWIIPYKCEEELGIFCHHIKIAPFVIYMNSTKIPQEKKLIKLFNL